MWQRSGWILALVFSAACLDVVSVPTGDTRTGPSGQHLWLFHIAGGPYAEHIQLVAIGDQADAAGRRVFRSLASRAWDGQLVNDFRGFEATPVDAEGLVWSLRDSTGRVSELSYSLSGDTAFGALVLSDGTRYPALGVRFDSAAANLVAPILPPVQYDSEPTVLIRLDDVPATDRDFLRRLRIRGLTAEIAAPTRFVGMPDRLTWDDLRYWRAEGMGVAMHSRRHLGTGGASAKHFISEIVGGFADMAANGFATHVFVQPGTWRDSIYFDSPAKLQNWRGALLETFASVSECYAYGHWLPRADIRPLGIGHITISDGQTAAGIRKAWQGIVRPNHATVLLVHTHSLRSPDQLDWFLDVISAAKAQGSLRVVSNAVDLFSLPAQRVLSLPNSARQRSFDFITRPEAQP